MVEPRSLRLLQLNTTDLAGGAAKVALSLHRLYQQMGYESILAVGQRSSRESMVVEIESSGCHSPLRLPCMLTEKLLGWQYLSHPGSHRMKEAVGKPDVIHLHNLHGGYFDLAALPDLSRLAPTILMMHDNWMQTGHCGYHMGCDRWRDGCGLCPHLDVYPALRRDGTRFNWKRKARILKECRLWLTAPSQWLADEAKQSPLLSRFPMRMIPNGVDLEVFSPGSREEARARLGLPRDRHIVLFLSNLGLKRSSYKDAGTLLEAMRRLRAHLGEAAPLLLAVGGDSENSAAPEGLEGLLRTRPFTEDERDLADCYRACDVFIHATRADNCPLTILEAMACGRPVVATAVGGIPELIEEGRTGALVPTGDAAALAAAIERALADEPLREKQGAAGRRRAEERYDLWRQAQTYLDWYRELVAGSEVWR